MPATPARSGPNRSADNQAVAGAEVGTGRDVRKTPQLRVDGGVARSITTACHPYGAPGASMSGAARAGAGGHPVRPRSAARTSES